MTIGAVYKWEAGLSVPELGALLALVPCWTGNWAAVSAARVLVYMLLCLVPALVCRLLLRK